MSTTASKYPVLTVSEGKVYIDGNRIRAVTDYSIERGDVRKPYAVLHLTVSIHPKLNINVTKQESSLITQVSGSTNCGGEGPTDKIDIRNLQGNDTRSPVVNNAEAYRIDALVTAILEEFFPSFGNRVRVISLEIETHDGARSSVDIELNGQ